ncbi:UNVERIFIED_CONTAM: putative mediator of RNA polymerase II transcription subunitb [Sesamum calycinum]|uniref:Mediator of RNA polymerase II transcription subunitb n=1 Tax=Sesamum calycinum TaxID=2727403 RepID=A0AAW2RT58_9LAMI
MANASMSLDKWREYFRSANSDIFDIIEHAILVAASDCPYDFKLKRDRIAERLFACKVTKCFGCERIELAVPTGDGVEKSEDKYKSGIEAGGSKDTKESKVNSSSRDDDDDDDDDDDHREVMEMNVNQISNYSYGDVDALTDEIEEESQFFGEVLRIKEILDNNEEESDTLLFDSLRKLQLMPLSVETLKATEIGKSVNSLRNSSKEIRNLVRTLIEDWKVMVDSWVNATAAIAGAEIATESVKTSVVEEEEGLPSPPLDEGAFFATPTSMELSQKQALRLSPIGLLVVNLDQADQSLRAKSNGNNEASVRMKLEAAKRKLQERYQEAENAKKQRTIQVVELRDLQSRVLCRGIST